MSRCPSCNHEVYVEEESAGGVLVCPYLGCVSFVGPELELWSLTPEEVAHLSDADQRAIAEASQLAVLPPPRVT